MRDKITKRFNIPTMILFILSTGSFCKLTAQKDLLVIKSTRVFRESVKIDSAKKMIELKTLIPGIQYDLRYATSENFLHKRLYKTGDLTFLRLPVALAVLQVENELAREQLGLKIWDAYRPYSVTVAMWKPIRDDRYVADPKKGSGHNRGIAVDLTLVNTLTGMELNMGTGFDNFSDTAHQAFSGLPADILQNRLRLKRVMEKYGFRQLETEWWHFYWHDDAFELLDLDFKQLRKLSTDGD